jgi:hypothetical protein
MSVAGFVIEVDVLDVMLSKCRGDSSVSGRRSTADSGGGWRKAEETQNSMEPGRVAIGESTSRCIQGGGCSRRGRKREVVFEVDVK